MGDSNHDFYASYTKTENIQILLRISLHNRLKISMGDVTNTYPYANTKEKVYVVVGPEFVNQQER